MRKFVFMSLTLLAGCAGSHTMEPADIQKNTAVSFDQYSKTATVSGPQEFNSQTDTTYWLTGFIPVPNDGPEVQLNIHWFGTDWLFLSSTLDIASNYLPTTVISRNLDSDAPGVVDEDVAVQLSVPYLTQGMMSSGLNLKIYGSAGSIIVTVPPEYIAGYLTELAQVNSAALPGRARLGATFGSLTPADQVADGLPAGHALVVIGLSDGGSAAQAGVEQKDVLISLNGRNISDLQDIVTVMTSNPAGTPFQLVVWREGQKISLKIAG